MYGEGEENVSQCFNEFFEAACGKAIIQIKREYLLFFCFCFWKFADIISFFY